MAKAKGIKIRSANLKLLKPTAFKRRRKSSLKFPKLSTRRLSRIKILR
jgi:hypothetical protein